jgi:hypothetical protein
MKSRSLVIVAVVAAAVSFAGSPRAEQGRPQLRIAAIANQGALKVGANTFRVSVQNSSQTTSAQGPVAVKLEILDPQQVKTEYTVTLNNGVPSGQDSTHPAWFRNVTLAHAGPHTVTAIVDPDGQFAPGGTYTNQTNRRTQIFTVPGKASAYRLTITVKNANDSVANGLRVAIKTADGQELFWKMTAGTGRAEFPALAPSPADKPYMIVVTKAALTVHTQTFQMPATNALLDIKLQP